HYGHSNALRQAAELASEVYVGIHSNESIKVNKGLPVMLDDERYEMVKSCKYVTKVVTDAPFVTDPEFVKNYDCSHVVHGNDLITDASGLDCYSHVKALNMFLEINRTYGISTTNIVGKMLLKQRELSNEFDAYQDELIKLFKNNNVRGEDIVFVEGAFDLFHPGHVYTLKQAKKEGDYVLVGLYSDDKCKEMFGDYPILNYRERLLALLSCKYVDEVILCDKINTSFVLHNNIKTIVFGEDRNIYDHLSNEVRLEEAVHEYSYLTDKVIIDRILNNYNEYYERNRKRNSTS
ncbi:hypothetical protein H312_03521, partial [Anncaliia algerae PRA339]